MRTKLIFTLFFSLLYYGVSAQQADSTAVKFKYKPNFTVGLDLLNAGMSFFSDRQLFQAFVSSEIRRDIHALAEGGFERNVYRKNGYDAEANGAFVKVGGFYMLVKDPQNRKNGFYGGGKLAGALYSQEYASVPVRGHQGGDGYVSFPSSSQSSYWLEGALGGRVQLFKSDFYIDVNLQPRYLLFTTKQNEIRPMIVPGFGKSSGKFNLGFAWNLAYSF